MTIAINNRYILHESLGGGAMGIVYRATDRLSNATIALKSVTIQEEELQFASLFESQADDDIKLALAQEFQTLASLRHPNIISVLDYGFDEKSQPYFTMNYLSDAQTILDAAWGQSTEIKVNFLIQILQALAYLHRRNILHRDLKPENVLVTEDRLRVLDFGLSVPPEQAKGRTGTLAYMAPETLHSGRAVEASDLYAVGVMAYQLFTGVLPFEPSDIMGIISRPVDLSTLNVKQELVVFTERLLQKDPEQRYTNAYEAISALNQVLDYPIPVEDAAIRESFLQAAKFVGRDKELTQLIDALGEATNGRGSAWLIGSESGVGKTRLLEELRIRALVQGAQVLRGQANEGQRQPYHIWQELLRRLCLSVNLNELEASVLKSIVPDIGTLIGIEVSDAPELDDQEAAQRLILTIANVIQKAAQTSYPLVLLLEDLHWAPESLGALGSLSRIISDTHLLVIGTFRTEETPDLPALLPDMQKMLLRRFSPQAIAELSSSMLGESGTQQQILSLLQEETEGNAFFLVETVRALAEEAGSLQEIDGALLPKEVFAGGVQQVIKRRLERVPKQYHPLLKLAAIAGRAIELEMLQIAIPEVDLETWLTTCANVAVLEIHDERWRFAHDKLREMLLNNIETQERKNLHNQVASALVSTYASELAPHYGRLAWHYSQTNEQDKERYFAKLAGEYAASKYSNDEALLFLNQAIQRTPDDDLSFRCEILFTQEAIYKLQGKSKKRLQNLEALQEIVTQCGDSAIEAQTRLCWIGYYYDHGDFPAAIETAKQNLELVTSTSQPEIAVKTYNLLASALWKHNDLEEAEYCAEVGLNLARKIHDEKFEAYLLGNKGMIAFEKRDLPSAQIGFEQSLGIAIENGFTQIQFLSLNNLGMVAGYQGSFQAAQNYYEQARNIAKETGSRKEEAMSLANLGWVSGLLGEFEKAKNYTKANIKIADEIGDLYNETYGLVNLSSYASATGDIQTALQSAEQAKALAVKIGDRSAEAWALTNLGHSYFASGDFTQAAEAYQNALNIRHQLNQTLLATEPAAGLARAVLEQGDSESAYQHIQTILPILEKNKDLAGTDDPIRVYLTCYLVLNSNNKSDAIRILEAAHDLIQSRAANIPDENRRKSFLENIPHHHEIQVAWEKHLTKTHQIEK